MKKTMTKIATIALMLSCLMAGAYAASSNRDIRAMFNNEEQPFTDVKGNRVYPITYNGTSAFNYCSVGYYYKFDFVSIWRN